MQKLIKTDTHTPGNEHWNAVKAHKAVSYGLPFSEYDCREH